MIILLNFTEPKMPLHLVLFLKIYLNKRPKEFILWPLYLGGILGFMNYEARKNCVKLATSLLSSSVCLDK